MAAILRFLTILVLALGANGYGQARVVPPEDAKPLHGERVGVLVLSDAEQRAVLQVTIYGPEDEIRYGDVVVRVFDNVGNEIPFIKFGKDDDYMNMGFGKYRGNAWKGLYNSKAEEGRVAKIVIGWKGEKVEFAPPARAKNAP